MNGHNLYALGVLVIITGILGVLFGIIWVTPGSIVIGLGLMASAIWMLHLLHQQEHNPIDRDAKRL